MLVKICGLSDAEHVAAAIEAGAGAVGFVFAESVRKIPPRLAAEISKDVPSHIRRVAVMQHPDNAAWQEVLETFSPDVLQTDAEDYEGLFVPEQIERWPVYREGGVEPNGLSTYVFEGPKSGQGMAVDWSNAAKLARHGEMILAGGLSAENVAAAIVTVKPHGVDVSSAVERSPGKKDTRLIQEFIRAASAVENSV